MAKDEPDTGIIRKISGEVADEKIEACQRTSTVRGEGLDKTLRGVEKTLIQHGAQIGSLTTQTALVRQVVDGYRWTMRALIVACLGLLATQAGTCIKLNGSAFSLPAASATEIPPIRCDKADPAG